MDMKELVAFAALQESRFKTMRGLQTDSERTYAYLAKLGEEYGELCEQILALQGHQRAEKADKFGTEKLGGELADVAIVLFVIAQNLGVDLPAAIGKKVEVVNERFKHVDA
jgi:NTP pyrophosphatase (non-canonical NTP hydrolase)